MIMNWICWKYINVIRINRLVGEILTLISKPIKHACEVVQLCTQQNRFQMCANWKSVCFGGENYTILINFQRPCGACRDDQTNCNFHNFHNFNIFILLLWVCSFSECLFVCLLEWAFTFTAFFLRSPFTTAQRPVVFQFPYLNLC